MDPAISTNNLSKRYGDVTAVDGLSLRVSRGEIYAFLGLNGAGKTTTIRMLLGMIKPTGGRSKRAGQTYRHTDATSRGRRSAIWSRPPTPTRT